MRDVVSCSSEPRAICGLGGPLIGSSVVSRLTAVRQRASAEERPDAAAEQTV